MNAPGLPTNGRAITRPEAETGHGEVVGDLAPLVELRHRDDVFVRGDLEHAVGGGVDNRIAGLDVARAELVDHGGAGRHDVANRGTADALVRTPRSAPAEIRQETSGRPSRGPRPSAPSGPSRSPCRRSARPCGRTRPLGAAGAAMPSSGTRRARPIAASVGIVSGTAAAMLPSVLLPLVPVHAGIRQLADADAVEDDHDGALEHASGMV